MIQLRLLKLGALLLLVMAVSMIFLISMGIFDPKPIGKLTWQQTLPTLTIPAKERKVEWLEQRIPGQPFSVRLTAVFVEGEQDSDYGLILGKQNDHLQIGVSPLGYANIQHNETALVPRQPWPHIKTGNEPNEIWINWIDDQLTIRLNRELIWVGEIDRIEGNLGIYGKNYGETAVFDFTKLELYTDEENKN